VLIAAALGVSIADIQNIEPRELRIETFEMNAKVSNDVIRVRNSKL